MATGDNKASSLTPRQRWNRGLWVAFAIVAAAQFWPLRTLGNRVEPMIAGLPFTLVWHLVAVAAWIGIYLLWMAKVWNPAADELDVHSSEDVR